MITFCFVSRAQITFQFIRDREFCYFSRIQHPPNFTNPPIIKFSLRFSELFDSSTGIASIEITSFLFTRLKRLQFELDLSCRTKTWLLFGISLLCNAGVIGACERSADAILIWADFDWHFERCAFYCWQVTSSARRHFGGSFAEGIALRLSVTARNSPFLPYLPFRSGD